MENEKLIRETSHYPFVANLFSLFRELSLVRCSNHYFIAMFYESVSQCLPNYA